MSHVEETQALRAQIEAHERTISRLLSTLEDSQRIAETDLWSSTRHLQELVDARTEELRGASQFLDSIIEALPNRICILDLDGMVVRVNYPWSMQIDVSDSKLKPGDDLLAYYREHRGDVASVLSDVIEGNLSSFSLLSVVEGKYFETTLRRLEDEAHILISEVNVTELVAARKRHDAERRQIEMLSLVARYTEKVVVILGEDGCVEWSNSAAVAVFGPQHIGQDGMSLASEILVESAFDQDIESLLEAGKTIGTDVCVKDKTGQHVWYKLELRRVPMSSRYVTLIIMTNITHRVHGEQELARERELLSSVIENVPHSVFWKDGDGVYQGANSSFLNLVGLSRKDVLGRPEAELRLNTIWGGNDPQGSLLVESGQAQKSLLANTVSIADAQGKQGSVSILADITEFKTLERQLHQAGKLESIGQLAAGVAHEINTPMQYIGDNLHFMQRAFDMIMELAMKVEKACDDGSLDIDRVSTWLKESRLDMVREKTPRALANARDGVEVVSKIIRSMKVYSHPGGEKTKVDINEALSHVVALSRNEWKYHADLETQFAEDAFAYCEIATLNQVFVNLIINAAQAIAEQQRHGKIVVRTQVLARTIAIEIQDDGPGIPESIQSRIFDPFFTTKEIGKGTGQGLSIARRIIEQSDGKIDFVSTPGIGTTFRLELPRYTSDMTLNDGVKQ